MDNTQNRVKKTFSAIQKIRGNHDSDYISAAKLAYDIAQIREKYEDKNTPEGDKIVQAILKETDNCITAIREKYEEGKNVNNLYICISDLQHTHTKPQLYTFKQVQAQVMKNYVSR